MRRCVVVLAALMLVMVASLGSAGATTKPPTAKALVQKLVKAHVCTNLQLVDAFGATVTCTTAGTGLLRLNAYSGKSANLGGIETERVSACSLLRSLGVGIANQTITLTVGPTWFAQGDPRDPATAKISKTLGGSDQTYRCT